jgi:hypothetical protein
MLLWWFHRSEFLSQQRLLLNRLLEAAIYPCGESVRAWTVGLNNFALDIKCRWSRLLCTYIVSVARPALENDISALSLHDEDSRSCPLLSPPARGVCLTQQFCNVDGHVQRYLPGSVQKAADTSDSAHERAPAALHFTKHVGGGGGPQQTHRLLLHNIGRRPKLHTTPHLPSAAPPVHSLVDGHSYNKFLDDILLRDSS